MMFEIMWEIGMQSKRQSSTRIVGNIIYPECVSFEILSKNLIRLIAMTKHEGKNRFRPYMGNETEHERCARQWNIINCTTR